MRKKIAFLPKTRKSQLIKRQLQKKNQMNPLEAAPKTFEEAGAMQLNS